MKQGTGTGTPRRANNAWRGVRLTTADALKVLELARWPVGKPANVADTLPVSERGMSVSELVKAMKGVHALRGRALTYASKRAVRMELQKILGLEDNNKALETLFNRLGL